MKATTNLRKDEPLHESFVALCNRIEKIEDTLQVFVPGTHSRQQVIDQVDRLLKCFPDQASRPPLFGIPVGVKDIFHCDGFITRCGSNLPPELFQGPQADAITLLKAAGAIVMGKTATTEFAYFAPAPTRNPINPAHTPGGSSSGSAAGVAAGFFDYALGTQTVGSVIRPASYCGIAGFKPSLGRISTNGVVPFSWTADHVGVFGRTVACLEPAIAVLADAWQAAPAPDFYQIRLGILTGPYLAQAEKSTLVIFQEKMKQLEESGCEIIAIPGLDDIQEINHRHSRLIAAEIAKVHATWFNKQQNRYRTATREIITTGMGVDEAELDELRLAGPRLRNTISEIMTRNRVDALIGPSTTSEAPVGLMTTGSPLMNLPWTHAGMPAVTLPAGKGPMGLPLGLQMIGKYMNDETLTALATVVETMLAR